MANDSAQDGQRGPPGLPPNLATMPLCTIGRKRKPEQPPTESPNQERPQSVVRKIFQQLYDQSGNRGVEDGSCPINHCSRGSCSLDGGVKRGKEDEVAAPWLEHIISLCVDLPQLHARFLRASKVLLTFIHCSGCLAPLEKCQLCSTYKRFMVHCYMCKVENCPEKDCVHMRKLAAHHRDCTDSDCLVCSNVRRWIAGGGLVLRDRVDKTPDLVGAVSSSRTSELERNSEGGQASILHSPSEDTEQKEVESSINKAEGMTFIEHFTVEQMEQHIQSLRKCSVKVNNLGFG